jgi:hypothetical protein
VVSTSWLQNGPAGEFALNAMADEIGAAPRTRAVTTAAMRVFIWYSVSCFEQIRGSGGCFLCGDWKIGAGLTLRCVPAHVAKRNKNGIADGRIAAKARLFAR